MQVGRQRGSHADHTRNGASKSPNDIPRILKNCDQGTARLQAPPPPTFALAAAPQSLQRIATYVASITRDQSAAGVGDGDRKCLRRFPCLPVQREAPYYGPMNGHALPDRKKHSDRRCAHRCRSRSAAAAPAACPQNLLPGFSLAPSQNGTPTRWADEVDEEQEQQQQQPPAAPAAVDSDDDGAPPSACSLCLLLLS